MPGWDSVETVGRVTLDKLGLNMNWELFQLVRVRRGCVGIRNRKPWKPVCSGHVALSISAFQDAQGVEIEPDKVVEQLAS